MHIYIQTNKLKYKSKENGQREEREEHWQCECGVDKTMQVHRAAGLCAPGTAYLCLGVDHMGSAHTGTLNLTNGNTVS